MMAEAAAWAAAESARRASGSEADARRALDAKVAMVTAALKQRETPPLREAGLWAARMVQALAARREAAAARADWAAAERSDPAGAPSMRSRAARLDLRARDLEAAADLLRESMYEAIVRSCSEDRMLEGMVP